MGGREVFTERLSTSLLGLLGAGHEVVIFGSAQTPESPVHSRHTTESGIELHRFNLDSFGRPPQNPGEPSVLSSLRNVANEFAPDVIHLHNFYSQSSVFLTSYLRASGKKIPTIYTIHDVATLSKIPDSLGGEIVGNATDAIVCPSRYIYERLETQKGIGQKKVVIIENGVPDRGTISRESSESLRVFSAANLHNHKGFVILLTAWAKISRQFPGGKLTLAGDGPEKNFLQDYCVKLGISNSVEFLGWLKDEELSRELSNHSMVVVPSLVAEAFGLVAAEAQMSGLPVIASAIGGLKEIVEDGKTGILCSAGSVSELSVALSSLMSNSPLRSSMGFAARERALRMFDMNTCTSKYLRLYESLIAV
ncbi:MAG: glycosyltransferase family 4 protein [Actinomycetota bacterium]